MNGRFSRGLVVGKFAPLHRGHEWVIRSAMERCDEVLVLSYSNPEWSGCNPKRRVRWLKALFPEVRSLVLECDDVPSNDAADSVHRSFVGQICLERFGCTVDAVFTSESYGGGFAAELTTFFRERHRWSGDVVHVSVDMERKLIPISATAIRADVHACRQWLSPEVYGSFVNRVCILGGESSGKSTLAAALARHYQTLHVEEYGRELWERQGGVLQFSDLLHIAERHVELEEAAAGGAHRYLFSDTSPLTTLFYSDEMFGQIHPKLEVLARRRYDLAVLCAPDFPFVQDGTRREAGFRDRQHAWYLMQLQRGDQPWMLVSGSVDERVRAVEDRLRTYRG